MKKILASMFLSLALCSGAMGQMLRYDQHREIKPPENATVRLGPFYSNLAFTQTAGVRYTKSDGTGTDFLFGSNRGVINEDGVDYPLVSTLDARNYVMISRHTDLDISFRIGYAAYPMGTQDDEFFFDIAEEGVSGSISMEFYISKFVRGRIFDDITYRTDYIDVRGASDDYGGSAYENLDNTLGLEVDWLMDQGKSMGASVSRNDLLVMSEEHKSQEHVSLEESVFYEQQLAAFIVGGVNAAFQQTAYETDDRAESSSQTYSIYASAKLTPMTTASASIGHSVGESDDLSAGEVTTFAGSASISTVLSREIMHGASLSHGLTEAFEGPFDLTTMASYDLSYEKDRTAIRFRTMYSFVEPQTVSFSEYASWVTSLETVLPVTRFMGLLFNVDYAVRDNGEVVDPALDDPEYTSDYETWSMRLGTSFSVTRKVSFDLYGQHIERLSDNPDLQYSRDIVAATFSFSHSF